MPPRRFKNKRTLKVKSRKPRARKTAKRVYKRTPDRVENTIPSIKKFKVEYATPFFGTASSGGSYQLGFEGLANCIYKPISSTQSFGSGISTPKDLNVQEYDILDEYFNKYCVTGCKVEATVTSLTTYPIQMNMQVGNDSGMVSGTPLTSNIASRDYVSSRTIHYLKTQKIVRYINVKKILGALRRLDNQIDYFNAFGTRSVNSSVWFNIAIGRLDDTNTGFEFQGQVKLTFYGMAADKKKEVDQTN